MSSSSTAAVMAREKGNEAAVPENVLVTSQPVMYNDSVDNTRVDQTNDMPISEFKAKCLGLVDDIATTGTAITLTKRGHAVARVIPMESVTAPLKGTWSGAVRITGDIVTFDLTADWELPG